MKRNLLYVVLIVAAGFLGYFMSGLIGDGFWLFMADKTTTEEVVEKVKSRLTYDFEKDRWDQLVLLAIKEDKVLEVWGVSYEMGRKRKLREYPIQGYIGGFGPKLSGTDQKIPEGIYKVVEFDPNHNFHRGLVLDFPNEMDRLHQASGDLGITETGYRFTIQGSHFKEGNVEPDDQSYLDPSEENGFFDQLLNLSEIDDHSNVPLSSLQGFHGNLAIGEDEKIDELFTMVYEMGIANVTVIVTPVDFRKDPDRILLIEGIDWEEDLYERIRAEIDLQLGSFTQ